MTNEVLQKVIETLIHQDRQIKSALMLLYKQLQLVVELEEKLMKEAASTPSLSKVLIMKPRMLVVDMMTTLLNLMEGIDKSITRCQDIIENMADD
ncbi:unnamed protein product [Lactuca virosa]|uniref:Uncharacterized protein n=1 Tax=Lactuca virosa TaxID=75947 RepID=A0AAU9PEV8_9ASTR|nr:unnamed protein product [Lactuca virosa]